MSEIRRLIKMVERMLGVISKRADTRLAHPELSVNVRIDETNHEVDIKNISSRGVRFSTETEFKKGDKLWLDIRSNNEKTPLSVSIKGRVVNDYGTGDDNKNNYGVHFNRLRFSDEIESIHRYVYSIKDKFMPNSLIT